MRDGFLMKGLAVGIIFLLVNVVVVPIININVVKATYDNERINVTIEACGIKGAKPRTITLTTDEVQAIKKLFTDLKNNVNHVKTKGEIITLLDETVVALDRYGLLPQGMNIQDAQNLVTSNSLQVTNNEMMNGLKKISQINTTSIRNFLCFTIGDIPSIIFYTPAYLVSLPFLIWAIIIGFLALLNPDVPPFPGASYWVYFGFGFWFLNLSLMELNPISNNYFATFRSSGDLWTLGLLGKQQAHARDGGKLFGFTGLKLLINGSTLETFLLGFSLATDVNI
jgi:hypothetical protein